MSIQRGEKIAFVGKNGEGKSTMIKAIMGELDFEGELQLGHNTQIGYFAQNQAEYLDPNKTVLDTMIDAANESNRSKVRDILGSFLFGGDEVDKFVKVLSGGERNRLALAKLLLQPLNVLVMDEPTNHLDIKSKNDLKQALQQFEGTLLLVSHDRDFLQGLTHKVYEFKDAKIREYLGDIQFYLDQRAAQDFRAIERKEPVASTKVKSSAPVRDEKKDKTMRNKLSQVEARIQELEKTIAAQDKLLAEQYEKTAQDPAFFDRYQAAKQELNTVMAQWEELTEALEA
jgi:ATP-binding cassette subfamily F protein 3